MSWSWYITYSLAMVLMGASVGLGIMGAGPAHWIVWCVGVFFAFLAIIIAHEQES